MTVQAAPKVRLITIGPGNAFWSAFGHTALAIDDRVYGFGYFSFEDEGLVRAFIDNQMYYDIGVSDFDQELELAEWQDRTFLVQDLYYTPAQIQQLVDYLEWHNLPENQSYRYDYFINNCATKIRDIIDEAWQGSLQAEFNKPSTESYFSQTFPANNQAMMNFGLVLGYGWSAYQKRTAWELMAFPVYLQNKMSELATHQISPAQIIYQASSQSQAIKWVKTHWFLWTYVVVLLLGLSFQKTRKFTKNFIGLSQVLLGFLILYFWMFSGHQITQWNFNILLFSPLVLMLKLSRQTKFLMLLSYLGWFIIAIVLQAWYFMPICFLHLYWLKQINNASDN